MNRWNLPVKSLAKPGEIFEQIPGNPPAETEKIEDIFEDFKKMILPGMTHWQSPNFFAYFPSTQLSIGVVEMLTATMGAQCMIWATSPTAAAELEEKTMNWLRSMIGLPQYFTGVIQDTASTATLTALLTARERASNFEINEEVISKSKIQDILLF
ncbi:MAG: pyridoxal-dependent decarboxylase [Bacteroidales bacterium]